MKTKFSLLVLAIFPLVLNANEVLINNLTPESLPQNPSSTYSIDVDICSISLGVDRSSIKPSIVIDGKTYEMEKSFTGTNNFTYDFKMPANANTVRYYFDVDYDIKVFESTKERNTKSRVYELHLTNRYASTLEVSRGPVGAAITISGRGLTPTDTVFFGDTEAKTTYVSPNLITFTVPTLRPGKIYDVTLKGNNGTMSMGEFKIDASSITANYDSIRLKSNESATLTLEIAGPAPKDGIELDVSTDIPDSIIMDDVTIPQNSKKVDATLSGGTPGTGTLFINAEGFSELAIPVTITEDEDHFWSD